jgi:transposase
MPLRPEDLSSDPAHLTEMLLAFEAENTRLRATIIQLKSMIFGSRSEKRVTLIAEQLPLDLDDHTQGAATEPLTLEPANDDQSNKGCSSDKPEKKRNRIIGALPKHLPRVDLLIEPETTTCPCCAGQLHRIGEDVSETLDRIPAVLRVLRTIRPKYACRACEEAIVQAKAPARLIEGGMVSTALVSHIAVAKYGWHSTLYRQMQILAGQGVPVDRQTLGRWMKRLAWWLKGLYELQLRVMHTNPRLFCDETPMRVLEPGRGRSKICQFWAHAIDDRPWNGPAAPAVAYVFAPSRGKKEIATQLTDFSGVLQVDAYAAPMMILTGLVSFMSKALRK